MDNNKKLQEISEDIFNMIIMLLEFCKQNADTQEMQCIYTCTKVLNKKADDLMTVVEYLKKEPHFCDKIT